jgi:hypothetical protein
MSCKICICTCTCMPTTCDLSVVLCGASRKLAVKSILNTVYSTLYCRIELKFQAYEDKCSLGKVWSCDYTYHWKLVFPGDAWAPALFSSKFLLLLRRWQHAYAYRSKVWFVIFSTQKGARKSREMAMTRALAPRVGSIHNGTVDPLIIDRVTPFPCLTDDPFFYY